MTIACLKLLCLVIQVGLPIQLLLFTHIVHLHRAEIMLLCTQAFFDWFHALDFCFLEMYPKLEDLVHCAFCNGEAMVDELWFALWVITITIKMLLYKLLYTNVHKCTRYTNMYKMYMLQPVNRSIIDMTYKDKQRVWIKTVCDFRWDAFGLSIRHALLLYTYYLSLW